MCASRYAEAPLGVTHRLRALSGLQNKPYAKWPSLNSVASAGGATPVACAPWRLQLCALWVGQHLGTGQCACAQCWQLAAYRPVITC